MKGKYGLVKSMEKYKYVKLSTEEIEKYTFLLEKVMAIRTLRLINAEGEFNLDGRKLKRDSVLASEQMTQWWVEIEAKYCIPSNGKERKIDHQRNMLIYEE